MPVFPDVLEPGLKVIFIGTAASKKSAIVGAPYAGPGNRFWEMLYKAGFTPRQLAPTEYRTINQYGLGLTRMVPEKIGNDYVLKPEDFDPVGVRAEIEQFQPLIVAFVGKRAAQEFLGHRIESYGLQPEQIGTTQIYVLPSTSGAARKFWDEAPWHDLGVLFKRLDANE
jgi:TDG/mug DNA glycosylase family protein